MTDQRADADRLSDQLADLLTSPLGGRPTIDGLQRLSGGASRETWAFDAVLADARHRLVLRHDPPGRPGDPGSMALEAELMRAAGAAGLPVPRVVADDDGSALGTEGLVMERIDGETLARRIQRDARYANARNVLAAQCGTFLAGLHAIDPASVDGLAGDDPLDAYRARWNELGGVSPTFELAFRWLAASRPPTDRQAILHGDFRLGNLIVDADGLAAAIDWELAHLGDPLEDLAWLCVKAWRFRGPLTVAGIGHLDDLLDAYAAASGSPVDRGAFHWWLVLNTLKWGVMCENQAAAHLTGLVRSVELAAIGRRVAEQEWDLLELLDPDACRAALAAAERGAYDEPGDDPRGLHGRPTAIELLDATHGFLVDDVMAGTTGHLQFQTRVAGNVVAIVRRQLQLGEAQAQRHRAALDSFGAATDAELAAAIASGALDDRAGQLRRALATTVRDKLAVAEPRHLAIPISTGA